MAQSLPPVPPLDSSDSQLARWLHEVREFAVRGEDRVIAIEARLAIAEATIAQISGTSGIGNIVRLIGTPATGTSVVTPSYTNAPITGTNVWVELTVDNASGAGYSGAWIPAWVVP